MPRDSNDKPRGPGVIKSIQILGVPGPGGNPEGEASAKPDAAAKKAPAAKTPSK